jgi:protein-serine/threonine kinase
MVDESSASAGHLSNPAAFASVTNSPTRSDARGDGNLFHKSTSMVLLRQKLTDVSGKKSGASTPTRALSSARPSQENRRPENGDKIDRTATSTPTPQAQAPAAKGKLTIKVSEARGLRKCQDPYVVVVFQRSELISSGPRPSGDDEDAAVTSVAMGGVPIQRQGSDSGRPMAIPMRSRQSSSTSLSEFNTFRNRNSRRSFTNPKWDAEAIL